MHKTLWFYHMSQREAFILKITYLNPISNFTNSFKHFKFVQPEQGVGEWDMETKKIPWAKLP